MPNYSRNCDLIEKDLVAALDGLMQVCKYNYPKALLYQKNWQSYFELSFYYKDSNGKYMIQVIDSEMGSVGSSYTKRFDLSQGSASNGGFDIALWTLRVKPVHYGDTTKNYALPRELKKVLKEYQEYWEYMDNPNRAQIEQEELERIQAIETDEDGRVLTRGDWQTALEVAEEPRSYGEHRAVFVDIAGGRLAINASAAIEYFPIFEDYRREEIKSDPRKRGDKLYKACELHKTFSGVRVLYATKEQIQAYIIKKYDSPEEK